MVLGGSFTSQRPLRQLAWELDYARCDGNVHRAENPAPPVPSLLALEQQLTVVWQLSNEHDSSSGLAGTLMSEDGSRVPVSLDETGSVLLVLGGGGGRWQQNEQHQRLQTIGYQLAFLQPAQNHYLLAAKSKDEACWHEAVRCPCISSGCLASICLDKC